MNPKPLLDTLKARKPSVAQWRNKERFVTAIFGLHGYPGVVLAADSEETISGYSTRSVGKVSQWENTAFRFAIGAAGAGHYADMVAGELLDRLYKHTSFSLDLIGNDIRDVLLDFHNTHIWPRACPDSIADAEIQLVIVVQPLPKGQVEVFHTNETAVELLGDIVKDPNCLGWISIGVGQHLADYILDRLYTSSAGESHLLATSVYVMAELIDNIATVGKEPRITLFRNDGTVRELAIEDIQAIEAQFTHLRKKHKRVFQYMTDLTIHKRNPPTLQEVTDSMNEVRERLRLTLEKLREY